VYFIATHRELQFVLGRGGKIRVSENHSSFVPILTIDSLTAVRGYNLLFQGLNFKLQSGQFAALRGPNGTGKTTLLRMIAGFIEAETGTIEKVEEYRERGPFYLGHDHGLRASETPLSHLTDWADIHYSPRSDIPDILERVGLTLRQHVPAYSLSAGQKKRVALARALITPRLLWLLDEPASALDTAGQALLCELMKEHLDEGGAILAAIHDDLELTPDLVLDLGAFA
tara:strand:- start:8790 stop:9473 length:684 start_codon:yes stop_codon:yes gene_type:complete